MRSRLLPALTILTLSACGGGGGGSDETPSGGAPVLRVPADAVVAQNGNFDPFTGVSATAGNGADLTRNVAVDGSVDTRFSGLYVLSYSVSDASGNKSTVERRITVNTPPRFTSAGGTDNAPAGTLYTLTTAATDADGHAVSFSSDNLPTWLSLTSAGSLSGTPPYNQVRAGHQITIKASDGYNSSETSYTINIAESVPSPAEAHRLLLQAGFGPSADALFKVRSLGMVGWLDQQLEMGSAYDSASDNWKTHLERTIEIAQTAEPTANWYGTAHFNEATAFERVARYQMAAWWDNALGAKKAGYESIGTDQLRQRVAYALSQIVVTSTSAPPLNLRGEGLAHFYDLLAENAFGNYRTLLGKIARSPAMGVYLSHMGNAKANAANGTRPDENFARELMQLFTIGLYNLNTDGSADLDQNPNSYPDLSGTWLPSYSQTDVEELAKVMTGWDLVGNDSYGRLVNQDGDYTQQMEFTPAQHEDEAEAGGDGNVTVLGTTFALNSGSDASGMDSALDILFNHPNVGPFISKKLIQRLVTSNPPADYIARVAKVFNDNGSGVRGDLKAVVRAILLDDVARLQSHYSGENYGKAKEPLLAFTQLLRAAAVEPMDGWQSVEGVAMNDVYWFPIPNVHLGQAPMRSPSVFNFYDADFIPTDPTFAARKLVGPEFQIQSDQALVTYNNIVQRMISEYEKNSVLRNHGTIDALASTRNTYTNGLFLTNLTNALAVFEQAMEGDNNGDYTDILLTSTDADGDTPKANGVDALIDHVNELLLGNTMTAEFRAAMRHYLLNGAGPNVTDKAVNAWITVRDAFRLTVGSAAYMIQK